MLAITWDSGPMQVNSSWLEFFAPRFRAAAELATGLGHYLALYNGQIPQRALGHFWPLQGAQGMARKGA